MYSRFFCSMYSRILKAQSSLLTHRGWGYPFVRYSSIAMHQTLVPYQTRINAALEQVLAKNTHPGALRGAMYYVVCSGGKRLRPLLSYATAAALDLPPACLDMPACALELVHSYSLIHDDLPAMDDDAIRRGKPTCHKIFGEGMAVLAGDALQSLAFCCLASSPELCASRRLKMVATLAEAIGPQGMAHGQALDIAPKPPQAATEKSTYLENIYCLKTGKLMEASIKFALIAASVDFSEPVARAFLQYSKHLGLAFQIQDDITDSVAPVAKSQDITGVPIRTTYLSCMGLKAAREKVSALTQDALAALKSTKLRTDILTTLTHWILSDHVAET